ncbi:MAG: hypothetical protein LBC68_09760 [Prevotellaceae bacterium]|jgi:hypothetical protein|nr:hypothetical protein [Prevotellaceae bacterium]
MSTTFKCWLIANLETVTAVVLAVIIIIPLVLIFAEGHAETNNSQELFLSLCVFAVIIPGVLASTPPKLTKGIIAYLLILLFGISMFFAKDDASGELIVPTWLAIMYLCVFIGGSVLGFFISRYAKYNFDEVVSRRMLYRNSSVSLFDIEWRYVLDRFCIASFCVIDAIVGIIALIVFLTL